jgi:hypothetical protein
MPPIDIFKSTVEGQLCESQFTAGIVAFLFVISEGLPFISKVKSNGVLDSVFKILKLLKTINKTTSGDNGNDNDNDNGVGDTVVSEESQLLNNASV